MGGGTKLSKGKPSNQNFFKQIIFDKHAGQPGGFYINTLELSDVNDQFLEFLATLLNRGDNQFMVQKEKNEVKDTDWYKEDLFEDELDNSTSKKKNYIKSPFPSIFAICQAGHDGRSCGIAQRSSEKLEPGEMAYRWRTTTNEDLKQKGVRFHCGVGTLINPVKKMLKSKQEYTQMLESKSKWAQRVVSLLKKKFPNLVVGEYNHCSGCTVREDCARNVFGVETLEKIMELKKVYDKHGVFNAHVKLPDMLSLDSDSSEGENNSECIEEGTVKVDEVKIEDSTKEIYKEILADSKETGSTEV